MVRFTGINSRLTSDSTANIGSQSLVTARHFKSHTEEIFTKKNFFSENLRILVLLTSSCNKRYKKRLAWLAVLVLFFAPAVLIFCL